MNKTEIMNTYAKEQGYENWNELMSDEKAYVFETMIHVDNVTDLIQEELKKKICETLTLVHDMPYVEIKETINETKIL